MAIRFSAHIRFAFLAACLMAALVPAAVKATEANECEANTAEAFTQAITDDACTLIRLTDDIDLTDANALDISNKTIDLNQHTISADNATMFLQGTNAVVRNGTFDSKGGSYALFIGDDKVTENFVVEDVTANGGFNIYNTISVILRNVNVTGNDYYAVWCDLGGKVTIESGTFKSNGYAVLGLDTQGTKMEVKGGTFEVGDSNSLVLENGDSFGKPEISGGSFNTPVKEDYCVDGFEPVQNEDGTYEVEIVVENITVNSTAHKKEYWVGEALDVTDLTIEATNSKGAKETIAVTADMVSDFDSSTAATVTLTITYKEQTTTFDITVKQPQVTGIAINSTGHKKAYVVGDKLDVAGMTIEVTKSDGTKETVAVTEDMISGFTSKQPASIDLTVTYQGVTTKLTITVKAAPDKPSSNVPTADEDPGWAYAMMGLAMLGMLACGYMRNKRQQQL